MLSASLGSIGALRSIELFETTVPLQEPIIASHGTHREKRALYVRVLTDGGEGWGEVAALREPVGSDPSLSAVSSHLAEVWLPRIAGAAQSREGLAVESQTISLLSAGTHLDNVASAAIEMALLDAELRVESLSLATWLESGGQSVPFGAIVGLPADGDIGSLVDAAEQHLRRGATRIRAKIEPGRSYEILSALRSALGPIDLHGDANGSFDRPSLTSEHLRELMDLDSLGLRCIEQPLATNDLTLYASLAGALSTPVCLDEGLSSVRQSTYAIRYGACGAFCIKPGRLGGIRAAVSVLERARSAGVECFIGGMFETGLGRASNMALAALPGASMISDVAAPSTYLEDDPCHLPGPSDGRQPLWRAPGVGPWPDIDRLARRAEVGVS